MDRQRLGDGAALGRTIDAIFCAIGKCTPFQQKEKIESKSPLESRVGLAGIQKPTAAGRRTTVQTALRLRRRRHLPPTARSTAVRGDFPHTACDLYLAEKDGLAVKKKSVPHEGEDPCPCGAHRHAVQQDPYARAPAVV